MHTVYDFSLQKLLDQTLKKYKILRTILMRNQLSLQALSDFDWPGAIGQVLKSQMSIAGLSFITLKCQLHVVPYLKMEFTVVSLALFVDQFKGVTSITIHMSESIGSSTVRKQEGHLVSSFWS